MARSARAAIVAVGNELLFGETVDTNAAWLGRTLSALGLLVTHRFTVGDVDDDIQAAVRRALDDADLVLISGGLGPTPDDRTKPAVSALLGRRLVPDASVAEAVAARFRAQGREAPSTTAGQSLVPEGATVLPNQYGTAPGLLLEHEGRHIVLLPGVPGELRGIVTDELVPRLDQLGLARSGVHHFTVHTTGCPESQLSEDVERLRSALPSSVIDEIDLAYLPDLTGVDLRFSVSGDDREAARGRFSELRAALAPALDPWAFEAPSGDLAEAVLSELRRAGRTVAVAESCTGGLVGARLTDHAGSSDVVLGGVIAYSNAVKTDRLGVDPAALEAHGAVSEPVVRAMVEGVARRFGASAAIASTGVAGPGGGSPEKPVGSVWLAAFVDGDVTAVLGRFAGDRASVRTRATQAALDLLYRRLRAG